MYKECFKLMDIDKDGVINKADLRAAFDNVGKLMTEGDLDDMLGEVGGECSFDNMVKMFQDKMAGGELMYSILYIYMSILSFYETEAIETHAHARKCLSPLHVFTVLALPSLLLGHLARFPWMSVHGHTLSTAVGDGKSGRRSREGSRGRDGVSEREEMAAASAAAAAPLLLDEFVESTRRELANVSNLAYK